MANELDPGPVPSVSPLAAPCMSHYSDRYRGQQVGTECRLAGNAGEACSLWQVCPVLPKSSLVFVLAGEERQPSTFLPCCAQAVPVMSPTAPPPHPRGEHQEGSVLLLACAQMKDLPHKQAPESVWEAGPSWLRPP